MYLQPLLPADHPVQQLFLPREFALYIPSAGLVVAGAGLGSCSVDGYLLVHKRLFPVLSRLSSLRMMQMSFFPIIHLLFPFSIINLKHSSHHTHNTSLGRSVHQGGERRGQAQESQGQVNLCWCLCLFASMPPLRILSAAQVETLLPMREAIAVNAQGG